MGEGIGVGTSAPHRAARRLSRSGRRLVAGGDRSAARSVGEVDEAFDREIGGEGARLAAFVDSPRGLFGERSLDSVMPAARFAGCGARLFLFCGCAIERGERLCAIAHLEAARLWRWRFSFWFFVCETDHGIFR